MNAPSAGDRFASALQAFQSGDLRSAEQLCRQLLADQPNHDRALFLVGLIAYRSGQSQPAAELIGRAIQINPTVAGYHANLSAVLTSMSRLDDAIAAANESLRLQPGYDHAMVNLANALLAKGQIEPAAAVYRRVIATASPDAPVNPHSPVLLARNNLARALHLSGRLDEAIALLTEATALAPNVPEFRINLANALKDQGRIEQAIGHYRAAAQAAPDNPGIGSAYLYALWFDLSLAPEQIFYEHRAWSQRHAEPLRDPRPHDNDRNPERRLRIGYLSSDFRSHTIGYHIQPILAQHDHAHFEIFCYSNVMSPDSFTEQLRPLADTWREIRDLPDHALARQIRDDRIDILVDLTCHMAGNRALVFARKPAPIQVNYLAYPATSGMSAIDYRITCPLLDPPEDPAAEATRNSERLFRIPNTFWCYSPSPTSPAPNDLPALTKTPFTFGSLNTYGKVNNDVVALWCEILRHVPDSQLLLLIPGGLAGNASAPARFEHHGIPSHRLRFVEYRPRDQYLALFHEIDLALDPFPYTGHTTSLDSLWMSVPFVTLAGTSAISRAGECILRNVSLEELIAPTRQRYVELCVELSKDLPRLSRLRRDLRHRMLNSPLTDAPTFTRNLESAYRKMWRDFTSSS